MRKVYTLMAAVAAIAVSASLASAQIVAPKKANFLKLNTVTAYNPCAAFNTMTTGALALPACQPAVRNDTVCGITTAGLGFIQANVIGSNKAGTQDIKLKSIVSGLDAGCIGELICLDNSVRASTNACLAGTSCTVLEALTADFSTGPSGCATVDAKGKYKLLTTTNTGIPGLIAGNDLTIQFLGSDLRRMSGPSGPSDATLVGGLLAPN